MEKRHSNFIMMLTQDMQTFNVLSLCIFLVVLFFYHYDGLCFFDSAADNSCALDKPTERDRFERSMRHTAGGLECRDRSTLASTSIMKTWFLLAAISLGALISGCSTYGNEKVADENISSVSKKLIQGKTTRSEVKALYGEPTLVKNTSAGEEIWTYNHFRITPDPKSLIPVVNLFITPDDDYSSRTLDITFNKKGIVKSYEFSSSDSKKGGL